MEKLFLLCLIGLFFTAPLAAGDEPGLQAGIQAPDFEAVTYQGKKVKLSDFYEQGPVVLVFYRGGWCMYCNLQLQELQARLDDFKAQGAAIVAVSVDLQANAAKTVEEKKLGFEVISDPDAGLLEQYNVIYQVPDELAKKYKEEYNIDLEAASGRSDHVISVPATYVIDRFGNIVFAHADRDYTVRPNVDEILTQIKQITTD